ncbi:MAG TPA: rhodanese-like domain-containing protein [Burkholderiales bacterium]|nr:rhodanese-like domain-containing protein [Burkholderiales bacterium]
MNTSLSAATTMERRRRAVEACLERVRAAEKRYGAGRDLIDALKPVLTDLALQSELFPLESFPVRDGKQGALYELSVDPDCRFALYASAGVPGKFQPPHDHTTWAVISGVHGDEHNVLYERVDDRSVAGRGRIEKRSELTVRRGNAIGFLGHDFHTIEVISRTPALHLHLYGRALDRLEGRVYFPEISGGEYKRFMAKPDISAPLVNAHTLHAMLQDGEELAVIDVREGGVFARAHLFHASSVPLSLLELRIPALMPNKRARVVLVDDDGSLAQAAARKMRRTGYLNLAVLDGGVDGWKQAGHSLYGGVNVPSKAFGEFIEHEMQTPRITAQELNRLKTDGQRMVILDSRPLPEYEAMSIPGAMDCPGAELVYRVHQASTSDDTLVVVNCAGRTRSIIGAQSLINAGVKNRVVALENGTMGWHLAGFTLDHGKANLTPAPAADAREKARAAAQDVARRYNVTFIDAATLEQFRHNGERTLYVFDVRLPDAYEAGHLPGALSAQGGQLVQATDTYAVVRNARIVLVDDDAVQAVMTASWLKQMGWREVYVLEGGLAGRTLQKGAAPTQTLGEPPQAEALPVAALNEAIAAGNVEVIDCDDSRKYRKGHVPGASWAVRSRLAECLAKLDRGKKLVFTSDDGLLARYAAADAAQLGYAAAYLDGGTRAWAASGAKLEASEDRLLTATDDVFYRPYDNSSDREAKMLEYLTWEVGLVEQVKEDPTVRFTTRPG